MEEDRFKHEEEDLFPPNFIAYMESDLKWLRRDILLSWTSKNDYRWVFWSRQDDHPDRPLSSGNVADFVPYVCGSPNVRVNIRHALQKMIWHPSLDSSLYLSLIQFWAATKTTEGRTLLTTQNQPFALGTTYYKNSRQLLGEYRMSMCREYNYFYADAERGEEQLGLPGRVFLHKFPESAPSVKHYSLKEYPQLNLALRCEINGFGLCQCLNVPTKPILGYLS